MKIKFTFIIALGISSFVSAQQVPNVGFETWTKDTLGSEPDNWYSSNVISRLQGGEAGTEKRTEGNGLFSARLTTTGDPFNPQIATLSNTPITSLATLPNIPGGFAYTQSPDSFFFQAQYDILPGDTALVAVIFKKTGSPFPISFDIFRITGTQANWEKVGFKLSNLFLAPDSVVIAFTSSNYFDQSTAQVGSYIYVDDIAFSTSNPLPNGAMENWTDIYYEHPVSWNAIDAFTAPFGITTCSKSSDSFGGNFAVRLENKVGEIFGNTDTFPGALVSASEDFLFGDGGEGGFPYSSNYTKLSGYYKYTSTGNDSATAWIAFSKNGVRTDSFTVLLPPTNQYTVFELPVSYSVVPDSAIISLIAGKASMDMEDDVVLYPGSVLLIDDVMLSHNPLSAGYIKNVRAFDLYPNPSTGSFRLMMELDRSGNLDYEVIDISGRKVLSKQLTTLDAGQNSININLDNQPQGVYLLTVNSDGFSRTFKLIVR